MGRRSSASSGGCCSCCSRVFLVVLNFILLLAALALIAVIFWIRYDSRFESQMRTVVMEQYSGDPQIDHMKSDFRLALTIAFWVVFGIAVGAAVVCCLGLIGGASGSRCVLGLFLLGLILVVLVEIAVGIFMIIYRGKTIHNSVDNYVTSAFMFNGRDAQIIRQRYNCCGANGVTSLACTGINEPLCSASIWDRIDFILMISGIILIIVVVLQLIKLVLTVTALASSRVRRETTA